MTDQRISPEKISKPIQLLAAWLVALVLLVGLFLGSASTVENPLWAPAMLVVSAVAIVPLFIGCILLMQTRYRDRLLADDAYLRLHTGGLVKSLKKSLLDDSKELRKRAVQDDLPKISEIISGPPKSATKKSKFGKKLGDIVRELSDPQEWIEDYIFVSGTYGYNVWPGEMEQMIKQELIEVNDTKVRLTSKGVKVAEDYNKSRLDLQ